VDEGRQADGSPRAVEYYGTVVELSAAIILREAAGTGWRVISAGFVTTDTMWAEYEQERPR